MSTYNIADFRNAIRSYIVNQISVAFPTLDVSENSVFDDLYIKPAIEDMMPFIENANMADLLRDLSNADQIDYADLSSIGVNNYGLVRNSGVAATTTVSIYYTRISDTESVIIPIGTVFQSSGGFQFQTTQRYAFTPAEMQASYDPAMLLYVATVDVTAIDVGAAYNLGANQITAYPASLSAFIDHVSNEVAITNGSDTETNADYASRMVEYYVSRYLGTKPGYKSDIRSIVSGLTDILVVGKDDDDMKRDIITVLDSQNNPKQIHIGGKTDIYLKGSQYEQRIVSLVAHTGKLKLSTPYSNINQGTLTAVNQTQPSKTVTKTLAGVSDVAYLSINNSGGSSYSTTALDTIVVSYKTIDTATQITDTFTCGYSSVSLDTPLISVISVIDADGTKYSENTNYTVVRTDADGNVIGWASVYYMSTKESAALNIVDGATIVNGTILTCTYNVNATCEKLGNYYDLEQHRITTNDIMIKEAQPIYVNIAFQVQLKSSQTLDDIKKVQIQNAVQTYINSLMIGEPLRESDIVNAIYKDKAIMVYLYYVKLPFTSFYEPEDISEDIQVIHDANSYIDAHNTKYIVLNKISITAVS